MLEGVILGNLHVFCHVRQGFQGWRGGEGECGERRGGGGGSGPRRTRRGTKGVTAGEAMEFAYECFACPGVGALKRPVGNAAPTPKRKQRGRRDGGGEEEPSPHSGGYTGGCLSPWRDLCVTRPWLPGGPLTDFGRRRPNLPLPQERVKNGARLRTLTLHTRSSGYAKVSLERAKSGAPGVGRAARRVAGEGVAI